MLPPARVTRPPTKFAENLGMLFFPETEFNDEYPFGVAVPKASASPSPSASALVPAHTTAVASGSSADGRPGPIRIVQGDLLSAQAQWARISTRRFLSLTG